MNLNETHPRRPVRSAHVIALHCSGADAGEWRALAQALGDRHRLDIPEHYGCESVGPWPGQRAFTLRDEAARTIALIDCHEGAVHLVGHSYGGCVALNVALARPERISSLTLYEPTAFHLLPQIGECAAEAYAEITGLGRRVCKDVITGDYRGGMASFVTYWNGPGAWEKLSAAAQNALIRWAPRALLDFKALIDDPTPADAYRMLNFPSLILRGEHAPTPTRIIVEALLELLPKSQAMVVKDAGHMGPLTHAPLVSTLIALHIVDTDTQSATVARWRGDGARFIPISL